MALVIADLSACKLRVETWREPPGSDRQLLEPGLERLYGQGRRRYRRARKARGDPPWPCTSGANGSRTCATSAKCSIARPPPDVRASPCPARRRGQGAKEGASEPMRELARRADALGELLGEEHDLAVLAARVRSSHGKKALEPKLGRGTRRVLLKAIARRRRRLQRRALKQGRSIYDDPTKKFVGEAGRSYARIQRKAARRAVKPVS